MTNNNEFTHQLNILLADDDKDDCFFFQDALDELKLPVQLTTVNDGEQLLQHLRKVMTNLPHVLFLDFNMPRKNGYECLTEIKKHAIFRTLPVIILSTSYDERIGDRLYQSGAYYYICKPADFNELKKTILRALTLVEQGIMPISRQDFLLTRLN